MEMTGFVARWMSDLCAIVTAHEIAPRLRTEGRGAQCSEMTNTRPAMTAFTVSPEQRQSQREWSHCDAVHPRRASFVRRSAAGLGDPTVSVQYPFAEQSIATVGSP